MSVSSSVVRFCKSDPKKACLHDGICSFLNVYGEVEHCKLLKNPKGRFTFRKKVSDGGINPVILSPQKFVRRVRY